MPGIDDYARQLRLLEQLEQEVRNLIPQLETERQAYRAHIGKAGDAGFMQDYVKGIMHRYGMYSKRIDKLILVLQQNVRNLAEHKRVVAEAKARALKNEHPGGN